MGAENRPDDDIGMRMSGSVQERGSFQPNSRKARQASPATDVREMSRDPVSALAGSSRDPKQTSLNVAPTELSFGERPLNRISDLDGVTHVPAGHEGQIRDNAGNCALPPCPDGQERIGQGGAVRSDVRQKRDGTGECEVVLNLGGQAVKPHAAFMLWFRTVRRRGSSMRKLKTASRSTLSMTRGEKSNVKAKRRTGDNISVNIGGSVQEGGQVGIGSQINQSYVRSDAETRAAVNEVDLAELESAQIAAQRSRRPTPEPSQSAAWIFISYIREDAHIARRLRDEILQLGEDVWLDERRLRPGDAWEQELLSVIRRDIRLFIPIISMNTENELEGYVFREWREAVERSWAIPAGRRFIVPVIVDSDYSGDPSNYRQIPDEFRRLHFGCAPAGDPNAEFRSMLADEIRVVRRAQM
jgi:ribosomal protein S8E